MVNQNLTFQKQKYLILFLGFFLLQISNVLGQVNPLEVKLTINPIEANAKAIIENIEEDTDIKFSYSDNIFDDLFISIKEPISLKTQDFLDGYFKPQGIAYNVIASKIILYKIQMPVKWFTVSGYIKDAKTSEDMIGATVYIADLGVGTVTNPYGFYSLKLPKGTYEISYESLGYSKILEKVILSFDYKNNVLLKPKTYNVSEVTVTTRENSIFLKSTLMNMVKIDIKSLQELPGLFGENDALRNLAILPGIQANELSTSSINVRGGSTDQTTYLMDEVNLYNASHFGGFFSIFNPDVVNNVNVYKSDIPVSEGGALSSLIDVRLREGNNQNWQVKGGIGLISARGLVEGPLKKDKSSVLIAFRRTYVDNLTRILTADSDLKNVKFYFYDANFKLNYKLNDNNRFFISGYAGSDVFSQYTQMSSTNYLGSMRWNHLFGPRLFTNTTYSLSRNIMTQGTQEGNELLYWESEINSMKFRSDLSYYYSDAFKCSFGYATTLFNIYPYSLLTQTEKTLLIRHESSIEQMMLNSVYYDQQTLINKKIGIDGGIRVTHMLTYPFTDSLTGVSEVYFEPQIKVSYAIDNSRTIKASISHQVQPLHQLPLSMVGVAINRWMTSNTSFIPQKSTNYTLGYYNTNIFGVNFSAEGYYRQMDNLIETMQDTRILYTDDPEKYLHTAKGTAYGLEMLMSYTLNSFKGMISYDYCKALWKTESLNNGLPYESSHSREHSLNLTGVFSINERISASAIWVFASGIPYTAATGKYVLDGKTYLQFDNEKINTKQLPPYHRLDLSLDIASKKNDLRKWKSFWNFSIYNAYLRKNALGVAYFIPDNESGVEIQKLNPGFFYLYQFVPSVSYRFEF